MKTACVLLSLLTVFACSKKERNFDEGEEAGGSAGTSQTASTIKHTGGTAAKGGSSSKSGSSSKGGTTNAGGSTVETSSTVAGGTLATGGTSSTGGINATGGTTSTGGAMTTGGTKSTGGNPSTGGASSTGGTTATGGTKSTGGASSTGGTTATGGTTSCVKTQGSSAGTVCSSCGYQVKAYYNCNGSRYLGTSYTDFSNNAACITTALCGDTSAYWVRNAAGTNGSTCDQFCASMGATCGNECTSFGTCPASTTAGYNQSETYGCDSSPGNQCSSTVAHPSNAFNAVCCCRGMGKTTGTTGCVKTEGSEAGTTCVGCGYKAKTYFHCDGTRYISANYFDYSSDAACVTKLLCNNTSGPYWTRNMNGTSTCNAFCESMNSTCSNSCTAFGGCPASTTAGYNQGEAGGSCLFSSITSNTCASPVLQGNNAYNAYCCCQVP